MTQPLVADEPLLKDGDVMDAAEFRRRYDLMPDTRAELIQGVVYVSSPVNAQFHGLPDNDVALFLTYYSAYTPGAAAAGNSTARLDAWSEVQPDHMLFVRPECGGQAALDEGYVVGAPELAWEIAASTAALDLGRRLRAYQAAGVREYVVTRTYDRQVDWFALADGAYRPVAPDPADGLVKSAAFPGLWLDPAALVRGDLAAVLAALQRGLATPAHAAFAARLRAAAGGAP